MSEWWLIGVLVFVVLAAVGLMLYPLRRRPYLVVILFPLIIILAGSQYYWWGGFNLWQGHIQHNKTQALAKEMLKTVNTPQQLIDKLRAQLDDSPRSAKGWYLLGKLYSSQGDNHNALSAFGKAYEYNSDEEQYAVYYAHSLWLMNNQQFNEEVRLIYADLLERNPRQPDALAMLAMDSYMSQQYKQALLLWQRLLNITPKESEQAASIRKAMAKAQNELKALGPQGVDTDIMKLN